MAVQGAKPQFTVIRPKRPIVKVNRMAVVALLGRFGTATTGSVATYPPSRSTYRRTGELGRRWTRRGPQMEGADLVVRVSNNARGRRSRRYPQGFGYARAVQGFRTREPKQHRLFRRYGWPSVEVEAKKHWRTYRPQIVATLRGRMI